MKRQKRQNFIFDEQNGALLIDLFFRFFCETQCPGIHMTPENHENQSKFIF